MVRWAGALSLAVAAVLSAAPAAGVPLVADPALAVGDPTFTGYERVAHLDAYEQPMTAVGYRHGEGAVIEVPLRNTGAVDLEVVGVDPFPELLGMIEVEAVHGLPVTLAPGGRATVALQARFGNCRYYTERAMNLYRGAEVTVRTVAGDRSVTLPYPSEVALRSPTILGCPDRVTDRSARQRLLARDE
jgi:hypothetical protein